VVEYGIANLEGDMLNSTIQTTDPKTGAELPIPRELLEKVERANKILQTALQSVGKKFDIIIRWQFDRNKGNDVDVFLSLSTGTGHSVPSHLFPKNALDSDYSIRRALSTTLWMFGDVLSAELQQEIEDIERNLQALTPVTGE
jgi:hypothetical protein